MLEHKLTPPAHWKEDASLVFPPGSDNIAARVWTHKLIPVRVLSSVAEMKDGEIWYHLSVSRPDRLPAWSEITKVKAEFLGEDTEAFHIIPKKRDYINLHSHCMHLWSPIKVDSSLPNLNNIKWERGV